MKLKPKDIKRYNKIAAAGKKPIMVRVNQNWYTWLEGDPKYGVFLTTQSGRDIEFGWKQIDDIQEGVMKLTKSKLKEIVKEVMNEGNPTPAVQKKLIKIFQNDPLYKDVIMATNSKDFKKAIDTLRSIRGPSAIALLKKHSKKLMGKDY